MGGTTSPKEESDLHVHPWCFHLRNTWKWSDVTFELRIHGPGTLLVFISFARFLKRTPKRFNFTCKDLDWLVRGDNCVQIDRTLENEPKPGEKVLPVNHVWGISRFTSTTKLCRTIPLALIKPSSILASTMPWRWFVSTFNSKENPIFLGEGRVRSQKLFTTSQWHLPCPMMLLSSAPSHIWMQTIVIRYV